MINSDYRLYDFFTLGETDAYGSRAISDKPAGALKMAIYTTSQTTQQNILYTNATYVGITSAVVKDDYIIQYGETKLKVLYTQKGRLHNVVYMAKYG